MKHVNDRAVEEIFDKFVHKAAVNGDVALEVFVKEMFAELNKKNLSYSKVSLKKRFLAEFEDDFEDDDVDEGLISNTIAGVGNTIGGIVQSIL